MAVISPQQLSGQNFLGDSQTNLLQSVLTVADQESRLQGIQDTFALRIANAQALAPIANLAAGGGLVGLDGNAGSIVPSGPQTGSLIPG